MGLYDFGFLHPTETVGEVIQRLLDSGAKVTKKVVAENLGCSESKVRRSKEWKEYQGKLNDGSMCIRHHDSKPNVQTVPSSVEKQVNDILLTKRGNEKPTFDFRETNWFKKLDNEMRLKCEAEIENGRSIADVYVEIHEDGLPLFSS